LAITTSLSEIATRAGSGSRQTDREPDPSFEELAQPYKHRLAVRAHRRDVARDGAVVGGPLKVRQEPEIFGCTFTIRTSRSSWLLSQVAEKSLAKRSTSWR
jgi:hypothetical protein